MALYRYQRWERRFVHFVAARLRSLRSLLLGGLDALVLSMRRRFTIVLVPPDQRNPRQISFTVGRCLLAFFLLIDVSIAIPLLRSGALTSDSKLSSAASILDATRVGGDTLRDEIKSLNAQTAPLIATLEHINAELLSHTSPYQGGTTKKSLFAMLLSTERHQGAVTDLDKLVWLRRSLEESTDSLLEAGTTIQNMGSTIDEMPFLWPLKDGIGHISMLFGYNPNPFTGVPYIHKGLDLGNYRSGDPIVASADGVVIAAYYDSISGYGNNVIIKHDHGFYTRYAHMKVMKVRTGQIVKQGTVIGILGSTGLVDAPHLHYEVRLGPEVLDPLPWIILKK